MPPGPHTVLARLVYPIEHVKEPVIYHLITDFHIVPNVHRAQIDPDAGGTLELELTGDRAALTRGVEWLERCGIRVERLDESAEPAP